MGITTDGLKEIYFLPDRPLTSLKDVLQDMRIRLTNLDLILALSSEAI